MRVYTHECKYTCACFESLIFYCIVCLCVQDTMYIDDSRLRGDNIEFVTIERVRDIWIVEFVIFR